MTENKFLKIKHYTDNGCSYYYAERLGVDSIAFVLHDRVTGKFGLIREFKPPVGSFIVTAFGGSLDKSVTMEQIVTEEVHEEAGYTHAAISYAGRSFVSTQMNQFCHLYLVDVTHATKVPRVHFTEMDEQSTVEWLYPNQVVSGDCWKAITILKKMGII